MIDQPLLPDASRPLRDGEVIVDTAKAARALAAAAIRGSETAIAERCDVSRSTLGRILGKERNAGWGVVQTQQASNFAKACGVPLPQLEWDGTGPVTAPQEIASVSQYRAGWLELRAASLEPYVPLTMHQGAESVGIEDIAGQIANTPVLKIVGASGSGKSHLLLHLGVMLAKAGQTPVLARAAAFGGDALTWLDRAVASCTPLSFDQLVRNMRLAGQTPILLVDAINETPQEFVANLPGELQRIRLRYDVPMVVTGQGQNLLPTMAAPIISISAPDRDQKKRLIEAHLGRTLDGHDFALDAVVSAHDASVWASVLSAVPESVSRHAYYAAFARQKLGSGDEAVFAYRALGALAVQLRGQFRFSVPDAAILHVIERVSPTATNTGAVHRCIEKSGLLPTRDGMTSFRHELFQSFFAAEALVGASADAMALAEALRQPIHAELQEFAVGALSSSLDIQTIILRLNSPELCGACLQGLCGGLARKTVRDLCLAALVRLEARLCAIRFDRGELDGETGRYGPLAIDITDAPDLAPGDETLLHAAATFYDDGLLDRLLAVFAAIDAHIEAERLRLRDKYPDTKMAWRARMFSELYSHPTQSSLWTLQRMLQGRKFGWLRQQAQERHGRICARLANVGQLSIGQLYFLIEELHSPPSAEESAPAFLYDLADHAWRTGIYAIRVSTCHMLVVNVRHAAEAEQKRFAALVESWFSDENVLLNSCVIDVLKALDALRDDFSADQALKEFEEVLAAAPSQAICERAFALYGHMIDHPYEADYGEAYFSLLTEEQRSAFRSLAIRTVTTDSMIYTFLLSEIAKHPTKDMIPVLQRLAVAPNPKCLSIQESISTYADACKALAALGADLPASTEAQPDEWCDGATILFSFSSPDQSAEGYAKATAAAWRRLVTAGAIDIPMRILKENFQHDGEANLRLATWSHEPLLAMARALLGGGGVKPSIFTVWPGERIEDRYRGFAVELLGLMGDRSDLPVLAGLVQHPDHGRGAIAAARQIEQR